MRSAECWVNVVVFITGALATLIIVLPPVLIYYRQPVTNTVTNTTTQIVNNGTQNTSAGPATVISPSGVYRYASVVSDAALCSTYGTDILAKKGGSAVDAIITTMLCAGVVHPQSSGVGGGHFLMIFDHERNISSSSAHAMNSILARERAPLQATRDMFVYKNVSSVTGGLAIGVPGEVAGFYHAWKKFGRVPWSELFTPAISLCRHGFTVTAVLAGVIVRKEAAIRADPLLREIFVKSDGSLYAEGNILKLPKLGRTLQIIADDPHAFYNPSSQLAQDIVADIQDYGGIVTTEDLKQYRVYDKEPLKVSLQNGNMTVYGPPPPSSGVIVQFILNVLDGYQFCSKDYTDKSARLVIYQKIIETYKFAFAKRSELGDEDFVQGIKEILTNLTSKATAAYIRSKITPDTTHDVLYYEPAFELVSDTGTSHSSVLAPDGSAAAITSSVNYYFGSTVVGKRTGIFFNNEMDDFSTPGQANIYGVAPSATNFIQPGKMPMSSMSPTIILDNTGTVKLVTGAAGGPKIITAVSSITMHSLWLNLTLAEATDLPRMHHQLLPDAIQADPDFDQFIKTGLQGKGHVFRPVGNSVAQSILNKCSVDDISQGNLCIHAASDKRKLLVARPDGY